MAVARKSFNDGRCFLRAETFLPETMNEFKRLLSLVLQTEVRINNLKAQITSRKNFDIEKAFAAVCGSSDGKDRVDVEKFNAFLVS